MPSYPEYRAVLSSRNQSTVWVMYGVGKEMLAMEKLSKFDLNQISFREIVDGNRRLPFRILAKGKYCTRNSNCSETAYDKMAWPRSSSRHSRFPG